MRFLSFIVAFMLSLSLAKANVDVRISKSSQTMQVYVNGAQQYSWRVSTGKAGYGTPSGSYRVQRMFRSYFSKKYYNSQMPYALFFRGGYAIHGTYSLGALGGPASHGCVRLNPNHAATLYSLVSQNPRTTRIRVYGGAVKKHTARKRHRYTRWA